MTKALVILSGGQDSTTCLFLAKQEHEEIHAITFDYGQRHRIELTASAIVAKLAGVASHEFINIRDTLVSASPLISDSKLDKYESFEAMEEEVGDRIENTFVPMRNALFLTIAVNRALHLGCEDIYIGVCQEDNANYPDCRYNFIETFSHMAALAIGSSKIRINTPLMYMNKAESVFLAIDLPGCMEALAYSHTSYDGKYPPTDMNHANILRAKGFEIAGVADPLVLRANQEGLMELPLTSNYDKYRK